MKSFDTELKKYAHKVRLTAAERGELRERVVSYMEYHPLPARTTTNTNRVSNEMRPRTNPFAEPYIVLNFHSRIVQIAMGAFAALFFIVIPVLAEYSVPGDVLYAVKTSVNEGIQAQFANSPYEKVAFETKLIERRIAEARLLASEGKLTEAVEAKIAETVKGHAEAVQSGIAEIRASDAEQAVIAQITFSTALEVQSAVLDTNESTSATSSTETILSVVKTVHEEVLEDQAQAIPAYESMRAQVESETTRAFELFTAIQKTTATTEEIDDINRRLDDINRLISLAEASREADEAKATSELANVLGLTQKLVAFMADIDVRETVALETLVPVVPTDEERMSAVEVAIAQMKLDEHSVLSIAREMEIDLSIQEKFDIGFTEYQTHLAHATASLGVRDVGGAEGAAHEARAYLNDVMGLMGIKVNNASSASSTATSTDATTEGSESPSETTEVGTTTPTGDTETVGGVEPLPLPELDAQGTASESMDATVSQ